MAQRIYFSDSRRRHRRSRRTDRLGRQRPDEAEHAVAASSTRPGRNIVRPCRAIPAPTVRTVRLPKCVRQRRWSRHPGAAGAARVSVSPRLNCVPSLGPGATTGVTRSSLAFGFVSDLDRIDLRCECVVPLVVVVGHTLACGAHHRWDTGTSPARRSNPFGLSPWRRY